MIALDTTLDRSERPYECCRDPLNLSREELAKQRYVERCSVCKRRHWVAEVDPVHFGLTGMGL